MQNEPTRALPASMALTIENRDRINSLKVQLGLKRADQVVAHLLEVFDAAHRINDQLGAFLYDMDNA